MNVLIAYASKTGTTAKCAKILKALVDDATLCDLTKEKPDLDQYSCVVVGGSIRMGKLHKASKLFVQKNQEILMKKKCAFFVCNCFTEQAEAYLKKNIPEDLMKKALGGGSSKKIKTQTSSEAIYNFAEKIK